ncbi:MAG: kinase to dihydroxyacetone kinase [Hungatella sp.]|nr:kinase to dihydroxyacetone kinase [Hungatella sp.]
MHQAYLRRKANGTQKRYEDKIKAKKKAENKYFTKNFQGDCLLAVGDEELIKIHFHTNEPWKVLEYCDSLGEIYDIVIEDMDRQSRGLKG